jgi:Fe-S-cluster containining protein
LTDFEEDPSATIAAAAAGAGAGMRRATVNLTVSGRKVQLQFDAPTAPTPPIELLPLFRSLTDTFFRIASEAVEAQGARISCTKGCGACCRQLVPISETEVESIKQLVSALPEPRRSIIVERFERAIRALQAAALVETLRTPETVTRDVIHALGTAYFALGITCPFLEDESCSIHADRPLACREYLVTSPAAHCAKPTAESIRCVAMPAKVSRAVRHLDRGGSRRSATWIPLILALEWQLRDEDASLPPGTASVAAVFERLTGARIPGPEELLSEPAADA